LRVHDPATGKIRGLRGAGSISKNEFHDIVWRIGLQQMQILVDGEERYRAEGDYSGVVSPVGIGPALGSQVDVESVVVAPLDPAVMSAPTAKSASQTNTTAVDTKTSPIEKVPPLSAEVPSKCVDPDKLVGWYKITGRDRVVPVLKFDGDYYSVSWPGIELPLNECPEGLECSTLDTTIGFNKTANTYFMRIVDEMKMIDPNVSYPGDTVPPEILAMTRINKPKGLLNADAKQPKTNDDFVGWFQLVWLPHMLRFEIRKEGEKYTVLEQELDRTGVWKNHEEAREISPLPDELGFAYMLERGRASPLTYNVARKRFELSYEIGGSKDGSGPASLPMPLARIPAPPSPEANSVALPKVKVGIPVTH